MHAEKEDPGGESPCAALAALTVVVGALFFCGGIWWFGGAAPAAGVESSSPLAPLILFAAVGAVLLVAGLHGLCQWPRQARDRHSRESVRPALQREPHLLQRR